MQRWWKAAMTCALVPLFVGATIFTIWYLTRATWLMMAGVINIYTGLAFFCTGFLCVVMYVWKSRQAKMVAWKWRALLAVGLLIANFPAAGGLTFAASYILSTYTVIVDNRSGGSIENLSLHGPTGDYDFGTVPPNSRREKGFHFTGEGFVTYSAIIVGKSQSGQMFGYITSGPSGCTAVMSISEDATVHVEERF